MMNPLWFAALALFSSISADFTSFHLHNYLNYSVSPCSDFHRHVCSVAMHQNETIPHKSERYYKELAAKLGSRSRNNPIMDTISSARSSGECEYDIDTYKTNLEERCGSLLHCYLEEFRYFYETYKRMLEKDDEKVQDTIAFFADRADKTHDIDVFLSVTSKLVGVMIKNDYDFNKTVSPYESLQDRLFVINKGKKFKKRSRIGLKKLRRIEKNLKEAIANRFKETEWLKELDDFGLERQSQFLTILDEMSIGIDFDEEDADVLLWRKMNRMITSKFYEYSKRSTGCEQFDVMHPFLNIISDLEDNIESKEAWRTFERISAGFEHNAYYLHSLNSIILFAPIYVPIIYGHSRVASLHGHASTIAHEIFHAFTYMDMAYSSGAFNSEYDCYSAHFNASCDVWQPEECNSGEQTFEEDAPDVEGLRVTFDLLKQIYSDEELQDYEYEDLEITREQAFFYAYAMEFCSGLVESFDPDDDHSNDTVRVNGVVAMMPEFTTAFGCQEEDEEYAEEQSVCYLFGPNAGRYHGGSEDEGEGSDDGEGEGESGEEESNEKEAEDDRENDEDEEEEGSDEASDDDTEADSTEPVEQEDSVNDVQATERAESLVEDENSGSGEDPYETQDRLLR